MSEITAYITGADRGLGLGLTEALLERGFRVFAGEYGLDPAGLDALAETHGERLRRIPLDVGCDRSVLRAADKLRESCQHLDLLINNAAILGDFTGTLSDPLDFALMQDVYNVNSLGPLRVAQSVFGHLKRGSMEQSRRTNRNMRYGYCMSKAALNVQTVILANHAGEHGIESYLFDPGWMRSFMHGTKNLRATQEPDETARAILATVLDRPRPDYLYMTCEGKPYDW
ncbi:SDR family NAD(P)-dependent oxidoreductase [Armatimonas sp.]|uniref:SDR family NAD(P)-dependent oxidoreductase n=1 Tax=Armatimonas sp. TaxID=1872638 RepID=UPI0037517682